MDVVSTCPLRVAAVPWQPRAGAWSLAVVCKATYTLAPHESPLAEEQDEPTEADAYWNDDVTRSLHGASDLIPFKKRAEVIVVGHAYAPAGRPVPSLLARVLVGDVDKSIEVVQDRAFALDGQLVYGPAFTRMPLRWERAAGGPGTINPIGVRVDARPDTRGLVPLPNLQPPGTHVTRPGDPIHPIGFGPIAPTWPDRWSRRHRVAEGWDHRAWQRQPLPPELDTAFFNAAPRDQQLDVLRSNERIVLENLHPDHPRLATSLAGVSPVAEVDWGEGTPERFSLRCDTLWIDADRGAATLTWRAQIPLSHPGRPGRVTISIAQPARRSGAGAPGVIAGGTPPRMAPFPRTDSTPPPDARASNTHEPSRPPLAPTLVSPEAAPGVNGGGTVELDNTGATPLPFRVGRSPLAGTVLGAPRTSPPPPVAESDPTSVDLKTKQMRLPPIQVDVPTAVLELPTSVIELPLQPIALTIDEETTNGNPTLARPLIGKTQLPPLPMFTLPPRPAESLLDIARCAAMTASIARRPEEGHDILRLHGIRAVDLEAAERRFAAAIADELAGGGRALLDAYDDAYVARLEEERGPISLSDHARLAVAAERGTLPAVLRALSLPRDAGLRIERVMLRRTLADPELARRARVAMASARTA